MTLIGIAAIGFLILAVIGKRGVVVLFLAAMALTVFVGSRAPVMQPPHVRTAQEHTQDCALWETMIPADRDVLLAEDHCPAHH
ncbi:MAG TPA: hypothetical protein VGI28_01830 [Stellaceae bacterium]|jgi:hypothetical protein